tara:strand:+ start:129 stop:356 length:228 start_codon:yes stop_codon:yes gene_type:complete
MNIQDEMQKIHHKYGVSEIANYKIEQFVEKLIETDRAGQLILHGVSGRFYSDTEIAILKEECYQDGIEEDEMNEC